ncbi:hypothetical protein DA01_08725 [Dehalococcoides mccartyi]|uniref:Uncharacterized protein n=1 Tax=Dehalococcoides mccartyi TaxID=61435 RepID=A0A0V8LXK8_9CHLR|nr:hypothetical protein [Dehalococcoides mccartyi]KSV16164.1 hypothetical protein DA01_08725 [Dehalococcoides mccartyi]
MRTSKSVKPKKNIPVSIKAEVTQKKIKYFKNMIADINVNDQIYKDMLIENILSADIPRRDAIKLANEADSIPAVKVSWRERMPKFRQFIPKNIRKHIGMR